MYLPPPDSLCGLAKMGSIIERRLSTQAQAQRRLEITCWTDKLSPADSILLADGLGALEKRGGTWPAVIGDRGVRQRGDAGVLSICDALWKRCGEMCACI